MYRISSILCSFCLMGTFASGQHPFENWTDAIGIRYASLQPVVGYTLRVDSGNLSFFEVEMHIRNAPPSFHIAMVAHPEYDDRFWRYLEDLHVETKTGKGEAFREDSALWRIVVPDSELFIRYRIHLPTPQEGFRAAWRPFLSPTGGLIGGPHSFMYIVGNTLIPSRVTLKLPEGWMIATGLEQTSDPFTFFAPSVAVLVDAPMLIGFFRTWKFFVDQVPHRVIYFPLPNTVLFDSSKLISHIQQYVQQTNKLFGRLPYREYTFLLQDGAFGALEHYNSVTIGLPSSVLSKNIDSYFGTVAHEYFHTWNLMRIRPAEFGDVVYKSPAPSRGLWWSEGLTMFYADLLLRRAGLPASDSTRKKHLEGLIARYYSSPGNMHISPEKVSLAANGPPGMLGDFSASTHLQGELLGTLLDLIILDATNGKYSMDDVMRRMMEGFSGRRGFTNRDIEQTIHSVCGCDAFSFFQDHIYGNKPPDFNKYLLLAGMRSSVKWINARDSAGKSAADLRVYSYPSPVDNTIRLGITDPAGCWGIVGLHTGDVIVKVNNANIETPNDFRQLIKTLQIGDTVSFEIHRSAGIFKPKVIVSGYKQPNVMIEELPEKSERQNRLNRVWEFPLEN